MNSNIEKIKYRNSNCDRLTTVDRQVAAAVHCSNITLL